MKKDKKPPIQKISFVTVEQIANGFIVITAESGSILGEDKKVYKSTMNGVINLLEESFGVERIIPAKEETTDTTVESILLKGKK